ncbi:MAG TPA: DNA polymerase III subunit gamma/tau C-terminal domain-containing protein, partial [Casimicrobiaceae bacterium]
PQKIPVTVLSRCLQFNLKALPQPTIAARLGEVLRAEDIAFDDAALVLIAHAARGSMRDALSLLDQAIAYGAGEVRAGVVRAMLGTVETEYIYRIADALIAADGAALLAEARALTERSLSLPSALDELAALFHRIAIAQTVPETVDALTDATRVAAYAKAFSAESVQLAYQICVQGRADLALAPDEPTGFAMTLLRLLAFEPATLDETRGIARSSAAAPGTAAKQSLASAESTSTRAEPQPSPMSPPKSELSPVGALSSSARGTDPAPAPVPVTSTAAAIAEIADWPAFVAGMKLSGIALQLAAQTELKAMAGNELVLAVPEASRHLTEKAYADKLKAALDEALGRRVRLRFDVGGAATANLAVLDKRERAEAQSKTEAAFRDDPFVQDVLARFDARIKPDSIKPVS